MCTLAFRLRIVAWVRRNHEVLNIVTATSAKCSNVSRRQLHTTVARATQRHSYELLVVGGGAGGSAIANKFCRKLGPGKVAVIEPSELHFYQAGFTLVGMGLKEFNTTHRYTKHILPKNCDWFKTTVTQISPEEQTVGTADGQMIAYKYMVVALGLQANFHLIKGLPEALENDPAVCSNYHRDYVQKTYQAARSFREGNAIFTFPNTPICCAGAPQKICYLTEDYFRRADKRNQSTVMYNTALDTIFGIPKYAQTLHDEMLSRDIKLNLRRNLIEVNWMRQEAVFAILGSEGETETYNYSMLHVAPPCSAPEVLWGNPISDKTGFVDVDKYTCQHVRYPNIFSLGDCANLPTSKTAAAISAQSAIVGHNLYRVMLGHIPDRKYNGYSSCPVVTKKGYCILAEFGYDGKILETFPFNQAVPRRSSFYMKSIAMPLLYWLLLVKGNWHGPGWIRKIVHLGNEST